MGVWRAIFGALNNDLALVHEPPVFWADNAQGYLCIARIIHIWAVDETSTGSHGRNMDNCQFTVSVA